MWRINPLGKYNSQATSEVLHSGAHVTKSEIILVIYYTKHALIWPSLSLLNQCIALEGWKWNQWRSQVNSKRNKYSPCQSTVLKPCFSEEYTNAEMVPQKVVRTWYKGFLLDSSIFWNKNVMSIGGATSPSRHWEMPHLHLLYSLIFWNNNLMSIVWRWCRRVVESCHTCICVFSLRLGRGQLLRSRRIPWTSMTRQRCGRVWRLGCTCTCLWECLEIDKTRWRALSDWFPKTNFVSCLSWPSHRKLGEWYVWSTSWGVWQSWCVVSSDMRASFVRRPWQCGYRHSEGHRVCTFFSCHSNNLLTASSLKNVSRPSQSPLYSSGRRLFETPGPQDHSLPGGIHYQTVFSILLQISVAPFYPQYKTESNCLCKKCPTV